MSNRGYKGNQDLHSGNNDFNATSFLIQAMLNQAATIEPVRVEGVDAATKTVTLRPLIHQVSNDGEALPHGDIFDVPYFRYQAGSNAVVLDPVIGDIGIAAFCARDMSTVVKTQREALPGSPRRFDWADAIYIGGILNGAPTQWVKITDAGVEIKATSKIKLIATDVEITGNLKVSGIGVVTGDLTAQGTSVHTHKHGGVQTGGGQTGAPI